VLPLYFCTLIRFSIEVWFKTKVLAEKWSHPLSKKNSHSFSDWTAHFLTNNVYYTFSQTVKTGVAKLRPTRVYYAARRHVHVCKIFEVLFRVFESQPVNLLHSSRTLSKLWTVTFVSLILTELCGQIVCKFSWQNTWLLSLIHIFVRLKL